MPPLKNKKHEQLVQEYFVDYNQTRAAIRAGYSPKSANQQSPELFAKPSIAARVEELQAERSRRTGLTADRVLQEIARLALVDPTEIIDEATGKVAEGAGADRAAIQSIKVKSYIGRDGNPITEYEIRLNDKVKALELLCKAMGITEQAKQAAAAAAAAAQGDGQPAGVIQIPAVDDSVLQAPQEATEDDTGSGRDTGTGPHV